MRFCFVRVVWGGDISREERITRGVAGMNDQSNEYHEYDKRQEEGEDDVQGPDTYIVERSVREPYITSVNWLLDNRGVQYMNCVMHKCITVKLGGNEKHIILRNQGEICKSMGNNNFPDIGGKCTETAKIGG